MDLIEIFIILTIHWIADFIFQSRWQANNKSKNNLALASHVWAYTLIWFVFFLLYSIYLYVQLIDTGGSIGINIVVLWFFPITFVAHFITDWITSRMTSYYYRTKQIHKFFVTVGFDQILHYVQLFLTYYILTK